MSNSSDARYVKCEERIQNALLELLSHKSLADIGVSELAREADVSRATFYAHYENVGCVFDQLVQHALFDVQSFEERFFCKGNLCENSDRSTYCEQIRSNGKWSNVVKDTRFFSSMMEYANVDHSYAHDFSELNLSKKELEALRIFQMSGCHAVATSKFSRQKDWTSIRKLIDTFIDGGLAAIRSRKI